MYFNRCRRFFVLWTTGQRGHFMLMAVVAHSDEQRIQPQTISGEGRATIKTVCDYFRGPQRLFGRVSSVWQKNRNKQTNDTKTCKAIKWSKDLLLYRYESNNQCANQFKVDLYTWWGRRPPWEGCRSRTSRAPSRNAVLNPYRPTRRATAVRATGGTLLRVPSSRVAGRWVFEDPMVETRGEEKQMFGGKMWLVNPCRIRSIYILSHIRNPKPTYRFFTQIYIRLSISKSRSGTGTGRV